MGWKLRATMGAMAGRQNLVLFLGLNPNATREAALLRQLGNQVILITHGRIPEHIKIGKHDLDLASAAGRSRLATLLKIPAPLATELELALDAADAGMRDKLAQLAAAWSHAERGGVLPGRMVISGEHITGMFWGHGRDGSLFSSDIKALAKVFPVAAAAVDDLFLSACNSATDMSDWPPIFPRLQTMWAYLHTGPSLSTGLAQHLRLWNTATRARQRRVDRLVAKNSGRGDNVAVWSRTYGTQTGLVEPPEVIRARIAAAEGTFNSFFQGDAVVADVQSGPLRQYYDDIQSLLQCQTLPADEIRSLHDKSNVTIRLIYFDKIRVAFQRQHQKLITDGYTALALPVPDFSRLNRKASLAEIDKFEAKTPGVASASVAQLLPLLVDGLKNLDKRYIPATWI